MIDFASMTTFFSQSSVNVSFHSLAKAKITGFAKQIFFQSIMKNIITLSGIVNNEKLCKLTKYDYKSFFQSIILSLSII